MSLINIIDYPAMRKHDILKVTVILIEQNGILLSECVRKSETVIRQSRLYSKYKETKQIKSEKSQQKTDPET